MPTCNIIASGWTNSQFNLIAWDFDDKTPCIEASFHKMPREKFNRIPGEVVTHNGVSWKTLRAKTADGIEIGITAFLGKEPDAANS